MLQKKSGNFIMDSSGELPLVTIVALCYNHSRYVIETLNSIAGQIYPNTELIIVDDASKDDSMLQIENWITENNIKCQFIRHKENRGICRSLNETLELAKGKYFKVIACDDVLLPQFVSTMVERFECLPDEYALLYSDVQTIDEHSQVFGSTPFTERNWNTEEKIPSGKLFDLLAGWCFIPAPGTFIRTCVLRAIRFDESLLIEDWDMWLQIAKRYKIKGFYESMVYYRIHRDSMYQQKSPSYQDHELRTAEKHLGYSAVADKAISDFIYNKSMQLYMHGGNRPLHWMWRRFLIKKTASNFLHVLLALLGITYQRKEQWRKKLKQV